MDAAGWRHFQHVSPGVQTAADLVSDTAHAGDRGLRLTAWTVDPENPPAVIETPPVWITSPPVPVEAGQIVCIRGWAQIPKAITAKPLTAKAALTSIFVGTPAVDCASS